MRALIAINVHMPKHDEQIDVHQAISKTNILLKTNKKADKTDKNNNREVVLWDGQDSNKLTLIQRLKPVFV